VIQARTLILIATTTGLWSFGFGLGSQVVSHWLHALGQNDTVVGMSHSFYYFGLAVGACAVPWLTRRMGTTACAAVGMVASGVTLALFPWGGDQATWYVLRFINGWAGAMSLVPLETLVSRDSAPEHKTQNFASYGVALCVGGALGIALGMHWQRPGETHSFYLGAGGPIVGGIALSWFLRCAEVRANERANIPLGLRANFLSYGTAWCQGFLEGGLLAFLSLFLVARGFSADVSGIMMGAMMVGVIVFQVPVAWLADRMGKTPVLLACYFVVAAGLIGIPHLANELTMGIMLFVFGACTGAMYPLGLSRLSDNMPESGLARAYAWYLAIECVGSQLGAAAMGNARDLWGETAMFSVGLAAVLMVPLIWLMTRRSWSASPCPTPLASRPRQREEDGTAIASEVLQPQKTS
jgi:MFS family permease